MDTLGKKQLFSTNTSIIIKPRVLTFQKFCRAAVFKASFPLPTVISFPGCLIHRTHSDLALLQLACSRSLCGFKQKHRRADVRRARAPVGVRRSLLSRLLKYPVHSNRRQHTPLSACPHWSWRRQMFSVAKKQSKRGDDVPASVQPTHGFRAFFFFYQSMEKVLGEMKQCGSEASFKGFTGKKDTDSFKSKSVWFVWHFVCC